jgi:pyrimidine-nucleoside phosphorylase
MIVPGGNGGKGNHEWASIERLTLRPHRYVSYVDNPNKFPKAPLIQSLHAPRFGYLKGINARIVGEVSVGLGAGRTKKEDPIDHTVGIFVHHKVGDFVEAGQPIFTIHANRATLLAEAERGLLTALEWSDEPIPPLPLFYGVIKSSEIE